MALQQIDSVKRTERMADCIDTCIEAAQACERCVTVYARTGDEDATRCIVLRQDVADLTALCAPDGLGLRLQ